MESLGEVLIIGVNGFLGRCLSSGLSLRGATVSGFSRTGDAQSCNCEHFFAGSVLDLPRLKEFETVIFLAGVTANKDIVADPAAALEVQVIGLTNVVRVFREQQCKLLLFASTGKVYGRYDHVPIDEKTRKSPLNFHGKAKSMAEDVLDFFGPTLPAASLLALRIFNVYGPGQDPRFVVPGLFRQIRASVSSSAGASSSLCKVAVSDPLVVRDFVFIDDVVGLYAALLAQRHTLQPGFQALNIGSGQGTSLSSLIEQVGEVCDVNVEAVRDDTQKRSDEMEQEYGDCSKVLQLLGWKTTTSMKEGLIKTLTVIKAEEAANRSK